MPANRNILQAALIGYQAEISRIEQAIAEIRRELKPPSDGAPAAPKRAKRKMSAAGRKRMAAAQKKRWAAFSALDPTDVVSMQVRQLRQALLRKAALHPQFTLCTPGQHDAPCVLRFQRP
jgi:hypothetical protein